MLAIALGFMSGRYRTLAEGHWVWVWAGISLQLENTVRLGDWVKIGNETGQVVSIRWRRAETAALDLASTSSWAVFRSAAMSAAAGRGTIRR